MHVYCSLAIATALALVTFSITGIAGPSIVGGDQTAPSVELGSAGRCGGTGGDKVTTLTCPTGQYIAAIGARAGNFLDEFSIACRAIPVPPSLPGQLGEYMSGGPGGGWANVTKECPRGLAITKISTFSGWYVDSLISARCESRSSDRWGLPAIEIDLLIGGRGGQDCPIQCPTGEAMYKVEVKHNGWVDHLHGYCRK